MCMGSNPDLHGDRTHNNGLGHGMVSPHAQTLIMYNTNSPCLYLGLSNAVFLTHVPVRNTSPSLRAVCPTNTITIQQSRKASIQYNAEFGTLLQLCWLDAFLHFSLHVYLQSSERVGGCAVSSKEPLRTTDIRAE